MPYLYQQYVKEEKPKAKACLSFPDAKKEYYDSLYPSRLKAYAQAAKEECEAIDLPMSFIYDEYPDKLRLYRLRDRALKKVPVKEEELVADILLYFLLEEIEKRRENVGKIQEA